MKKFLFILLCVCAFFVGTTGCVFEDIEDEPTAVAVCVGLGVCLALYCLKCVVQALSPDEEEQVIEALSKHTEAL